MTMSILSLHDEAIPRSNEDTEEREGITMATMETDREIDDVEIPDFTMSPFLCEGSYIYWFIRKF
jgi:hypothetical protein